MLYYDTSRKFPAFRRPVDDDLQPFIPNSKGNPRTEWRYSFRTFDKLVILDRYAEHLTATNAEIRKAEDDRAAWLLREAKTPAERDREERRWLAEQEASELRSQDAFQADMAVEEREPLRRQLIAHLSKPLSQLTQAEVAMRELIPDSEFDPQDVKDAREAARRKEWDDGAREAAAAFANVAPEPAYHRIVDLLGRPNLTLAEEALFTSRRRPWLPMQD